MLVNLPLVRTLPSRTSTSVFTGVKRTFSSARSEGSIYDIGRLKGNEHIIKRGKGLYAFNS